MARLIRLAHEVEHALVLWNVEVEVDLHSPLVGVGRHSVPDRTLFEVGQTHRQLAGLEDVRMDVLVDCPLVGVLEGAKVLVDGLIVRDESDRARLVGRTCENVELGRLGLVDAPEGDLLRAHGQIEGIIVLDLIVLAVDLDDSIAADVDRSKLSSLQKIMDAEVLPGVDVLLEVDLLVHRHGTHGDDPVDV